MMSYRFHMIDVQSLGRVMTRIHCILWKSPDLPYYDQFELSSVSSFARFKQTFRTWELTKDFKRTFHRAEGTCIGQFENHSKFLGETSHGEPGNWSDSWGSVANFRTAIHETEQKIEHFRFPMLAFQRLVGFDEDHFFGGNSTSILLFKESSGAFEIAVTQDLTNLSLWNRHTSCFQIAAIRGSRWWFPLRLMVWATCRSRCHVNGLRGRSCELRSWSVGWVDQQFEATTIWACFENSVGQCGSERSMESHLDKAR